VQFVTLSGAAVDLGLDASAVVQVALASEWMDLPPLDLGKRLRWTPAPPDEARARADRVLVVRSRHGDVPVRAGGQVGLREAQALEVLGLPPEVLLGDAATALSGVLLQEGRPPVLLLVPEGLWRLFEMEAA
jgi:hypothetical protein